jgi:glutaredoxin 3
MSEVIIYTKDSCGYCRAAKRLLDQLGLKYREIEVTHDVTLQQEMLDKSAGRTTVPQIFIDGEGIGGYTELYHLVRTDKLALK